MVSSTFFRDIVQVSDKGLCQNLAEHAHRVTLRRGALFQHEGTAQQHIAFLETGYLRAFHTDSHDDEVTDCLLTRPGSVVAASADLLSESPVSIEALTDCSLVTLEISYIVKLVNESPQAGALYNRLIREGWQTHHDLSAALKMHSSQDRYQWFLEAYPGVIDVVPHRHIASFLGMTPVTLSRVRASLRDCPPSTITEDSSQQSDA